MNARRTHRLGRSGGFTIPELIAVMVITGIVASFAIPRFFDRGTFDSRGFYDQVISSLRYAQKEAIAQRRFVCAVFTGNSVTLTIDLTPPSAMHTSATCPGGNLASPDGNASYIISSTSITLSGYSNFNFDAQGRPSVAQNISVSGFASPIIVEAETGYVH